MSMWGAVVSVCALGTAPVTVACARDSARWHAAAAALGQRVHVNSVCIGPTEKCPRVL